MFDFVWMKKLIRIYTLHFAIVLFLVIFIMIHVIKPSFVYSKEGGFRPFGVGYLHKTVVPIWFVSIIAAIFSYTTILYILSK